MRGLASLAAAAGIAAGAEASVVLFYSDYSETGRGAYEGSMEWSHDEGADNGTLVVQLKNTSDMENGGFLTAFGFNSVAGVFVSFDPDASGFATRRWRNLSDFNLNGYGHFDWGAGVKGRWGNSTSPVPGISVGRTKAFYFNVLGDASYLAELTAESFFNESSSIGFIARFRGFDDDGKDTVTARVPSPGPLALLGLGAGMVKRRRR